MALNNPNALLLLPAVLILLAIFGIKGWQKKRAAARAFSLDIPALRRKQIEKYVLLTMLAILVVSAAALPQVVLSSVAPPDKAGEIALLVDVSGSMAAQRAPNSPSRLARVQSLVGIIVDRLGELGHPRVSLHGFTDKARSLVPLVGKEDYGYLRKSIELLTIYAIPGRGSMLGQPLLDVIGKFSPATKTRIVVLFSDGEPFIGGEPVLRDEEMALAEKSVQKAQETGVIVVTVGIGEREGAKIPLYNAKGEFTGAYGQFQGGDYVTRLQDTLMRDISGRTGGQYFDEGHRGDLLAFLGKRMAAADSLDAPKQVLLQQSIAQWFLVAALLLLAVFARRHLFG
jgi:hypothetical protein